MGEVGVEQRGQGGVFLAGGSLAGGVPFVVGGVALVEGGVAPEVGGVVVVDVGGSFLPPPLILLAADFLEEVLWPTVWRALTTSVDNFLMRNSFSRKLII